MSHNLGGSFQSFDLHRSDIHKHTILVRKNDTITSSKTFGSVSRKILIKHYTVHAEMRRAGFGTEPKLNPCNSLPESSHWRCLWLYLIHHVRRIILRAVDLAANRVGFHETVRVWQCHCLNLDYISEVRVEPCGVIFRLNNDRHT